VSTKIFRLVGIEPDNLLALLALLGALRATDRDKPYWNVRSRWSGTPWRPEIEVDGMVERSIFIDAVNAGVATLAEAMSFAGYADLKYPIDVARGLLKGAVHAGRDRERLFAALMSDGAVKDDGVVAAPALCTMLGQGHQHFLTRLETIGRGGVAGKNAKKNDADLSSSAYIERALFETWLRGDATDSFRWDPAEDRRYALRELNPSKDPGKTEHGANRLAVVGLPLLTSLPTGRRGAASIATIGFSRTEKRRHITWPIWTSWLDLETVLAILVRPELHGPTPLIAPLHVLGVAAAYRSYRVENGYYANFTRAEGVT